MHSIKRSRLPFVHTTDLGGGVLHKTRKQIAAPDLPPVHGPAVLLPRVGKPDVDKIVLFPPGATAVLSDCVLAIECSCEHDAERVHALLTTSWPAVEAAYGGTCARFISIQGLHELLSQFGCRILPYGQRIKDQTAEAKSHEWLPAPIAASYA